MTFQPFSVAACLRKETFYSDHFDEMHRTACCSQYPLGTTAVAVTENVVRTAFEKQHFSHISW